MSLRSQIESQYQDQIAGLSGTAEFQALESGALGRDGYDRFLHNVARTHLLSPHLLAFLFALAPPAAAEHLRHNLLEEMGIDEEDGVAHPDLLRRLLADAGLGDRLVQAEADARSDLRRLVSDPLVFGTIKEVGLGALTEIVAFEYMLSRLSSRIGRALAAHRGLGPSALAWFTHHSEVDIRHAEEGLRSLVDYASYYGIPDEDAMTIVEMTLRENVFTRRYFAP